MRLPIVLSLGLLFASTAIAASSVSVPDPWGDEAVEGFDDGLGPSFRCHDAAIDVREVGVATDDGTVRVELRVEDVGSGRAICPSGRTFERIYLEHEVHLRPECDQSQRFVCARTGPTLRFVALDDGYSCAGILLPDGTQSDQCIGTTEFSGNSVVWTLPLHGSFVTPEGDTRSFDARGTTVRINAWTRGEYGPHVAGQHLDVLSLIDWLDESPAVTL